MNAGDAVKKCGFSGAIGADKGDDFPLINFQIQLSSARSPPKSMVNFFTSSIGFIN